MATLSGNKIKNTYQSLVKFSDNGNITTSAKQLTDGFGNNSPMFVSTTQVGIGVTPESGLNLHIFGDAKIGSNLTVIGNLVVEGSTTTVGTDTLTVKDPLIVLANNNTSTDAVDIGFYGKYTPSGTTLYSGLFREALTGKYRLFKGLEVEPTTTVNTSGTGYAVASLVANLEGNVTGNLTGSVTGGSISGTTGTFSGNVDIDGQLDVDDVISVEGSAFGRIEIGGVSGGYIDLKAPNSDDYDFRIITSSGGNEITTATGDLIFNTAETLALTLDTSQNATFEGNIILSGTVDGRDISVDGTKLDGIESGADVTDATNVLAAGAVMTTGNQSIAGEKTFSNDFTVTSDAVFNGNINLDDDERIRLGTSNAFQLYYDSTLESGQGGAIINSNRIFIETGFFQLNSRTGENMIKATSNGNVELYNNDSKKLETTNTGITVTGTVSATAFSGNITGGTGTFSGDLTVGTDSLFVDISEDSVGIGLTNPSAYSVDTLVINTPDEKGITLVSSSTEKAYIAFQDGTGSLENFMSFDHAVNKMNFNVFDTDGDINFSIGEGVTKFNIDNTNVRVYDDLTVDGNSTFAGDGDFGGQIFVGSQNSTFAENNLKFESAGDAFIDHATVGENVNFRVSNSSSLDTTAMTLFSTGNANFDQSISVGGNATFTGKVTAQSTASNTAGQFAFSTGGNDVGIREDTSGGFNIDVYKSGTGYINPLTIDSSGIVKINTTAVNARFRVDEGGTGEWVAGFKHTGTTPYGVFIDTSGNTSTGYTLGCYTNTGTGLFLKNDGKLGIGTASPDTLLNVNSLSGATYPTLGTASGVIAISINELHGMYLGVDGSSGNGWIQAMREDATATAYNLILQPSGGNVGIGTDSPYAKLEINDGTNINLGIKVGQTDTTAVMLNAYNDAVTANIPMEFRASKFAFDVGNVGIGVTPYSYSRLTTEGVDNTSSNYAFIAYQENTNAILACRNDGQVTIPSGNLGIGTNSPDAKLHIYGSSTVSEMYLGEDAAADKAGILKYTQGDGSGTGVITLSHWGNTSTTQSLAIKYGGNVGIGTTSPAYKTSVFQSGDYNGSEILLDLSIKDTVGGSYNGGTGAGISFSSSHWSVSPTEKVMGAIYGANTDGGSGANGYLSLRTRSSDVVTEKMRITSGGDVLINLTGPITTRYSTSIGTTLSDTYSWFASNDSLYVQRPDGTNGNAISFFRASVSTGSISLSGSATAYNTSSDYRLKEDLQDFKGLEMVSKIPVYDFKWKTDESRSYGVMAHELQEVLPDAVTGDKDAINEDESINPQGVDYSKIVPLLIKSIQELKAEVDKLKQECKCKN